MIAPWIVHCLLLALFLSLACAAGDSKEELLIGWQGETYQPGGQNETSGDGKGRWAFVYHNFLTPQECDHLVKLGSERVSRSLVVDAKTGQSKLDDIRTSYGAAFARGEDPIIAGIEEKIAEWTHLPPENGEPIQVLRYVDGQKYDAHWDWFDDPVHHKQYLQDGNRYATVLMYLAEVEEGGETALPLAQAIDEEVQQLDNPSQCAARMGISIRPAKGDALLFFDMDVQGSKGDRLALHASCPTLKGTKWTATKWIHNKRYMGNYDAIEMAGRCVDIASDCAKRVKSGKCYDKPDEMVGPAGECRKSCGDCTPCPRGDIICYRKNMRSRAQHAKTPSTTQ